MCMQNKKCRIIQFGEWPLSPSCDSIDKDSLLGLQLLFRLVLVESLTFEKCPGSKDFAQQSSPVFDASLSPSIRVIVTSITTYRPLRFCEDSCQYCFLYCN